MQMMKKKATKEKLGSVYFNNNDTELSELAEDLNSMKLDLQKEAMKQIIASMTIGKDVSPLFPQVVICMRTKNVELKKLIYLYIVNYARAKPDITILAVNAFHQDATDKDSPLLRALAVRTMGCIRVDTIVQYLSETLKLSLKDEDAYVRKTACFCVAKLFGTCPSLVKEMGFYELLEDLLNDGNAVVVSSALICLGEINSLSADGPYKIRSKMLKKILLALNETNEWGVVYILDALAFYKPKKIDVAEKIIEAIIPKLTHSNSAVIISAVKIIMNLIDFLEDNSKTPELLKGYFKKLSNSIVTIIKSIPEIQYSLLRSIHVIIEKRPKLLKKEFRYFYIEFNDPLYVKLEKLDILYKLTDEKNHENIISEFKSYAITEYNQEIIIKSFKYLAAICFKFPKSADFCSKILQLILTHGENFISNQAIIVINDYLRKYKNSKSLELLKFFNLDFAKKINLPESKSAFLYIIGEYCQKIKDCIEILQFFCTNFANENERVKTQILNASIKIYISNLNNNNQAEEITKYILEKSAEESENPDLRDKAYIYWRLLDTDPDSVKEMLLGEKPDFLFKEEKQFDKELLDDLIENLTNISCLYQKKSTDFLHSEDLIVVDSKEKSEENDNDTTNSNTENDNDNEVSNSKESRKEKIKGKRRKNKNKIIEAKVNQNDFDLLGLGETGNSTAANNNNINFEGISSNIDIMDIFGFSNSSIANSTNNNNNNNNIADLLGNNTNSNNNNFNSNNNNDKNSNDVFSDIQFLDNENEEEESENNLFSKSQGISKPKPFLLLDKTSRGKNGINGLKISGLFHREKQNLFLGLHFENNFNSAMSNFSIEISKNPFGLNFSKEKNNKTLEQFFINSETKKNLIVEISIEKISTANENLNLQFPLLVNVIIKNNIDDFDIKIPLHFNLLNLENGKMSNQNFMEFFKKNSNCKVLYNLTNDFNNEISNDENLTKIFEKNFVFLVAKNNKSDPPVYFYSGLLENNLPYVFEASFSKGFKGLNIKIITNQEWLIEHLKNMLDIILKN